MPSSHYSNSQAPSILIAQAERAVSILEAWLENEKIDPSTVGLAYSGMSGIAAATALSLEFFKRGKKELAMFYVRKRNEESHGNYVEYRYESEVFPKHMIFVDDFYATGRTRKRIIRALNDWEPVKAKDLTWWMQVLKYEKEITRVWEEQVLEALTTDKKELG